MTGTPSSVQRGRPVYWKDLKEGIVDVVVVRVVSPGAGGAVVGTWTVWDVVGAGPPLGGSSPMRAYEPIVVIVG